MISFLIVTVGLVWPETQDFVFIRTKIGTKSLLSTATDVLSRIMSFNLLISCTVTFLNNHNIQGLKIHSTYVIKNTTLADWYYSGKYTPISLDFYLKNLSYIITHISPEIIIHRISGDAPKDLLIAPDWNLHKKWILNGFDKVMAEQNLYQG